MTFLAPWALLAGVLAAAGVVALHLVARRRPASYPLPTARFVPDRRTLVSRASRRPRDLLLLLLRVLLILSAAAAFARPVLTPRRSAIARILLLDRSAAVANPAEATRRARELVSDGVPTRLIAFDSAVAVLDEELGVLDSLDRVPPTHGGRVASVSALMAAARRLGSEIGAGADSVELALVSPLTDREVDAASDSIRALWPGRVRLVPIAATPATRAMPPLGRAVRAEDVLGPALGGRTVREDTHAVRLVRGEPSGADSALARSGGVVVRWDSIGTRTAVPLAVAMGDDVVVATLARTSRDSDGVVLARWADGSPAAIERPLGEGCLREVAIGVPVSGDLPLSPTFQRIVNGLTDACASVRVDAGMPLDSARRAAFIGPARVARGSALADSAERPTPITSWLLGVALACALLELLLRRSYGEPGAAEAA